MILVFGRERHVFQGNLLNYRLVWKDMMSQEIREIEEVHAAEYWSFVCLSLEEVVYLGYFFPVFPVL